MIPKSLPGLDPVWKPVFGKDHAPPQYLEHDPIQLDRIML
jgi:hypothetical protein